MMKTLKMEVQRSRVKNPFFSICIPQYNRTSFLIESCKSLLNQTFFDFEVCISDDCSTDGREEELLKFLEETGLSFTYRRQAKNLKYDANLRMSIGLARGKYCFLLGNDDCLSLPTTLEGLYKDLQKFENVGVVITNYEDFTTGQQFIRIRRTEILGEGPSAAANYFRNFSFVSGILLDTLKTKQHATSKWDRSEMYQMFLGCRLLAEGNRLLGIDRITVRRCIQIQGEDVESIRSKPRLKPCPILEREIPLTLIGRLVIDAIDPYLNSAERGRAIVKIFLQVFLFTYPFWIFEYRRIQSWRYALGICLGMRPKNTLQGLVLNFWQKFRLTTLYAVVSLVSLLAPVFLFQAFYPYLYCSAKTWGNTMDFLWKK